jgi:hypothetical protein
MTRYQAQLSPQDVDALCATARQAWRQASRSYRRVLFVWRQKCFIVRHMSFRLIINEANGRPVACV